MHWPRVVGFLQSLPPYALIGALSRRLHDDDRLNQSGGLIHRSTANGQRPPKQSIHTPPPKPPSKNPSADIGCGDGKYLELRRYSFHPTAFALGCDRSVRLLACAARASQQEQEGEGEGGSQQEQGQGDGKGSGNGGRQEPSGVEVFACDVLQVRTCVCVCVNGKGRRDTACGPARP